MNKTSKKSVACSKWAFGSKGFSKVVILIIALAVVGIVFLVLAFLIKPGTFGNKQAAAPVVPPTVTQIRDSEKQRNDGRTAFIAGYYAPSEAKYQEAVKLNSLSAQNYADLGTVQQAKKDYVAAEASYKKAIELNTAKIVVPNLYLGRLYAHELNRADDAIKVFESGIAMNPNYPDYYFEAAQVYKAKGDTTKANEYLQKYYQLMPSANPANKKKK